MTKREEKTHTLNDENISAFGLAVSDDTPFFCRGLISIFNICNVTGRLLRWNRIKHCKFLNVTCGEESYKDKVKIKTKKIRE